MRRLSAAAVLRLVLSTLLLAFTLGTQAQGIGAPAASAGRWDTTLAEFAAADRQRPPAEGGVVFVGSSSIRLWPGLPQAFSHVRQVLNRGFGGSTMADCQRLVGRLVIPYRPRQVVVYSGENDLAEGRSPAQVRDSFRGFVEALRSELPGVRIAYVSIKPSPLRAELMPQIREANRLLAAYLQDLPNAEFVDVFTPMLDDTGAVRGELFGPDRLHMNDAGYALWRRTLVSRVAPDAPLHPVAEPLSR